MGLLSLPLIILIAVIVFGFKAICIVPQQEAYVVERLGKFRAILEPGLNFLIPFFDRVAYKHTQKEIPLDVPSQVCITRDNTQLTVDGIIYFQVTDPKLASYGSSNYIMAITQLAQTTLRSVIGRMELDKTFEERDEINRIVVAALDEAAVSWGVKVLRYEIKDLIPPQEILRSMQAQITAEPQAAVNASNGEKTAKINLAQGEAEAIRLVAQASADAIRTVAEAIRTEGGNEAVKLKVAEQYVEAFAKLAKENNTLILPANVADIGGLVAAGLKIAEGSRIGAKAE